MPRKRLKPNNKTPAPAAASTAAATPASAAAVVVGSGTHLLNHSKTSIELTLSNRRKRKELAAEFEERVRRKRDGVELSELQTNTTTTATATATRKTRKTKRGGKYDETIKSIVNAPSVSGARSLDDYAPTAADDDADADDFFVAPILPAEPLLAPSKRMKEQEEDMEEEEEEEEEEDIEWEATAPTVVSRSSTNESDDLQIRIKPEVGDDESGNGSGGPYVIRSNSLPHRTLFLLHFSALVSLIRLAADSTFQRDMKLLVPPDVEEQAPTVPQLLHWFHQTFHVLPLQTSPHIEFMAPLSSFATRASTSAISATSATHSRAKRKLAEEQDDNDDEEDDDDDLMEIPSLHSNGSYFPLLRLSTTAVPLQHRLYALLLRSDLYDKPPLLFNLDAVVLFYTLCCALGLNQVRLAAWVGELTTLQLPIWLETFDTTQQQWVALECVFGLYGSEALSCFSKPNSSPGTAVLSLNRDVCRDVTARYCEKSVPRQSPFLVTALQDCLLTHFLLFHNGTYSSAHLHEVASALELEKRQLEAMHEKLAQVLPKSQGEYRNHPSYALVKFLTRYQTLRPKAKPVGVCGKLEVFRRADVLDLHTRDQWHVNGMTVKDGAVPLKRVSSRLKADSIIDLFAEYQCKPYEPIVIGEDMMVPKNEHGNVDLLHPNMMPINGAQIRHPNAAAAARKLGISYAKAFVDWERHLRHSIPVFDGIIVAAPLEDVVLAACEQMEQLKIEKELRERYERVSRKWRSLARKLYLKHYLHQSHFGSREGYSSSEEE